MGTCKLCHQEKPLLASHIFPKFVIRWIIDTGVTGKIREGFAVNKRVQDSRRIKLLCKDCEGLFSRGEKYFSETIFKPVLDAYNPVVNYDDRLLKFAVSLSWRFLVVNFGQITWKSLLHKQAAQIAEKQWREFLLQGKDLDTYGSHLLALKLAVNSQPVEGTTVNDNWYFFRVVDGTIVQNDQEAFVFIKLPGFVFISNLYPEPFVHMEGTIIQRNGQFDFNDQMPSKEIFEFLFDWSKNVCHV